MDFFIRKAQSEDMTFIKDKISNFRLDDEDLDYRQFVVAVGQKNLLKSSNEFVYQNAERVQW